MRVTNGWTRQRTLYLHGQSEFLYTHGSEFGNWLDSRNPGWDNGCG